MTSTTVGFLGPEGSFSHEAVSILTDVTPIAFASFADILSAVASGDVRYGLVPLENALEGTVSAVIDGLVFDQELIIQQEVILPIRLELLARPGVALGDVTQVRSYTHALGQCRTFLQSLSCAVEQSSSTSQAAREVAESSEPWAAVASPLAGKIFGLTSIASDIEDHPGNATKFVLVGKDDITAPTGHDRTSIVCFQDADRPGSLYGILGRFAARDINLTKLESRPSKRGLGDYCFVIEFEGHVADDVVADCLADLQAHLAVVKFLGSYPVTGDDAAIKRDDVSAARQSAATWIDQLRGRVKK